MSLIGEALKRARLEAARRDAEDRGTVYSEAPAYLPAKSRSRRSAALGFLAAGLVVGLAVGAAFFLIGRERGPADPGAPANAQPAPTTATAPPLAAATPAPLAPLAPPATVEPPATASLGSAGPTAAPSSATRPSTPTPRAPALATAAAEPPVTAAATPEKLVSGRTYLRTVLLASGERLELDGIVASDTEPLTMLNRQLVGLGESVLGFAVEEIEPNRVKLRRGDGVVVYLRLRETPAE